MSDRAWYEGNPWDYGDSWEERERKRKLQEQVNRLEERVERIEKAIEGCEEAMVKNELVKAHELREMTDSANEQHGNELKKCPFCGGSASIRAVNNVRGVQGWLIMCDNCTATIGICKPLDHAIEAWNRRGK